MDNYLIRQVLEVEFPQCVEIIEKNINTVADQYKNMRNVGKKLNKSLINVQKLKLEKKLNKFMYGLFVADELCGYLQFAKLTKTHYEIEKLTVLPEYRRIGYATVLVDFTVDMVKCLGGTHIRLGVIENNKSLKKWYMDYGFEVIGNKTFKFLPFEVASMELNLSQPAIIKPDNNH